MGVDIEHGFILLCLSPTEMILKMQKRKLELADSALTGKKTTGSKLTLDDLKMMFQMGTTDAP